MKSSTTAKFREAYDRLPEEIRRAARKQFKLWQRDHRHQSLQFKVIGGL